MSRPAPRPIDGAFTANAYGRRQDGTRVLRNSRLQTVSHTPGPSHVDGTTDADDRDSVTFRDEHFAA
jgi:hypothetical protein